MSSKFSGPCASGVPLLSDIRIATFVSYLFPRAYPLLLILLFTWRFGQSGVGEIALVFSIVAFLGVVCDWGVSQWLLLRPRVDRDRIRELVVGRSLTALLATIAAIYVGQAFLSLEGSLLLTLAIGTMGTIPQMLFGFYIHGRRPIMALFSGVAEYIFPLGAMFAFDKAVPALAGVLLAKATLAGAIFPSAIRALDRTASNNMALRKFGTNYSLWALTSVGTGTGELLSLNSSSVTISGGYRLLQTASSAGSIVGAAAQAPLMSRVGRQTPGKQVLLALGLALVSLLTSLVAMLILTPWEVTDVTERSFLVASAMGLLVNAGLSSAAIVPASSLSRLYGSRPLLYSGIASAAVYWIAVGVSIWTTTLMLIPLIPSAATLVGLVANLLQLKLKSNAPTISD